MYPFDMSFLLGGTFSNKYAAKKAWPVVAHYPHMRDTESGLKIDVTEMLTNPYRQDPEGRLVHAGGHCNLHVKVTLKDFKSPPALVGGRTEAAAKPTSRQGDRSVAGKKDRVNKSKRSNYWKQGQNTWPWWIEHPMEKHHWRSVNVAWGMHLCLKH